MFYELVWKVTLKTVLYIANCKIFYEKVKKEHKLLKLKVINRCRLGLRGEKAVPFGTPG